MFPVSVHVVGVNVVRAWYAVHRLQDNTRVVVRDHVGIAILWLVVFKVGVVPGELLPRLDALVFLRELVVVVGLEKVNVAGEL